MMNEQMNENVDRTHLKNYPLEESGSFSTKVRWLKGNICILQNETWIDFIYLLWIYLKTIYIFYIPEYHFSHIILQCMIGREKTRSRYWNEEQGIWEFHENESDVLPYAFSPPPILVYSAATK